MSEEQQQRIRELEEQVKELEEILWKSVEANTASSNLVAKMMKRYKPDPVEPPRPRVDPLLIEKGY